jgi:hypothetical protein
VNRVTGPPTPAAQLLADDRVNAWRSMLTHQDLAACEALIAQQDAAHPSVGWGSFDRNDILRNVPELLQVIEQREACARCPGLAACCERPGPRGAIVHRLEPHVTEHGLVRLRTWLGPCRLRQDASAAPPPSRGGWRRARGGDHVPF